MFLHQLDVRALFISACAATLTLIPLSASAVSLLSGSSVDTFFYEDAEITAGDPDWFGTELAFVTNTATERRDGFDGFEVVEDLFIVDASLGVRLVRSISERLVFQMLPGAFDVGMFNGDGPSGAQFFSISGFAGYDVDYGWFNASTFGPLIPGISRSADGDTISIDLIDLTIAQSGGFEEFYFAVDAPDFRFTGTGTATIEIASFGSVERTFSGYPVPSAVPVPASAYGLALGLSALGLMRRRRRAASVTKT